TPEQRLVGTYRREPAAGESIERKRRNADGVELSLPHLNIASHATRAMLEHDERQPARTPRDPKLTGGRRCLCIGVAAQELRVRQRQSVNRMKLSSRGHLPRHGLGECGGGYKRNSKRQNETEAVHRLLPFDQFHRPRRPQAWP